MTQTIAIVIPAFNEAESIGQVVRELRALDAGRIIVVDGGSSDGTPDIVRAAGGEALEVGRGYGLACLKGAEAAAGSEIIVFMDGDGADNPAFLASLVDPILRDEQDFTIGSRVRGRAEPGSMSWRQKLAGLIFGLAAKFACGQRYTDMCAFRAIRRATLLRLGMQEMTYGWNLEMQLRAGRAGLRILEIPVDNRQRIGGESKVSGNLRGTWNAGRKIIAAFVRFVMDRSEGGAKDAAGARS